MAGALHRALTARGVGGPLILAGHSIGGVVAVAYAARYRAHVSPSSSSTRRRGRSWARRCG
jgi:pimeloyl-ACP methyl ester carboxylesterase